MLGGIGSAQETEFTYDFEACDQGWTVESNSAGGPLASTWERSDPGNGSEEGMAFRLAADPVGAQDEALISPAHTVPGGETTVSYFLNHDIEADFDFLTVDWSSDGGETWSEPLKTYTGASEGSPEFVEDSATFTAPAGPIQIRFHYVSDDFTDPPLPGPEMAVDDVTIPGPGAAEAACPSESPSGSPTGSPSESPTGSPTASPSGSPTASPSPSPTPDPRGCTIIGTEGPDDLSGTPGDDVICGLGGNDMILGRGGNDVIYGDAGRDTVKGGSGNDKLKGGSKGDTLKGGKGNDRHNGGSGKDRCIDNKGKNRFKSCEMK
jgi:hypothetical protein